MPVDPAVPDLYAALSKQAEQWKAAALALAEAATDVYAWAADDLTDRANQRALSDLLVAIARVRELSNGGK